MYENLRRKKPNTLSDTKTRSKISSNKVSPNIVGTLLNSLESDEYICCANCHRKKHPRRYNRTKGGFRFFICIPCMKILRKTPDKIESIRQRLLDREIWTDFPVPAEACSKITCEECGKRKPSRKFWFSRRTGRFYKKCTFCREKNRYTENKAGVRAKYLGTSNLRWADPFQERDAYLKDLGFESYEKYVGSPLWLSVFKKLLPLNGSQCSFCSSPANAIYFNTFSPSVLQGKNHVLNQIYLICTSCEKALYYRPDGTELTGVESRELFRKKRR